ncbi:DEAD/DEAH box helicase [Prosthecobacter sp.]|uniref:DEAD/DEAH box helicase n=1 Tax=Prosthecobacter sp. TaxID=1965333 RepID=UPI001DDED6CA|nr:DEAD/DEAH box helicase [Prosthecobacter sp.]MCB1277224.1 DEAD/DEAH box helicase [Prosthecobacter sp.]
MEPGDFSFSQLWTQVRSKSWLWLFRRQQIEEGGRLLKHGDIGLAGVHVCAANEVEIIAGVGTGLFNSASVTAHLRLRDDGSMAMTSHCTCAVGTLCQHAAALMLMLDHEEGRNRIEGMARVRERTSVAPEDEPEVRKEPVEVEMPPSEPRPLLLVRRMMVEMPQITAKRNIGGWEPRSIAFIQPCAEYDDCPLRFEMLVRSPAHQWEDESGKRHTLVRNLRSERLLLADLSSLGFKSFSEALPGAKAPESTLGFMAVAGDQALFWSQFLKDQVPKLRETGWRVEVPEGIGFQIHEADEDAWFTDLAADQGGREWFSLDLGVEIEGRRISMVPLLVDCVDQGLTSSVLEKNLDQRFLLSLGGDDGDVLSVPAHRLVVLLRFFDELLATRPVRKDGKLQLDKLRAAQLATLDGMPIRAPAELTALSEQLGSFREIGLINPPASLKASLRDYQREGASWMQFLREFGLHGILADDMGLGKTLQTLTHILVEKESGRMKHPCLIVAPTSVLRNWINESIKFTPTLSLLLMHGQSRKSDFKHLKQYDLVVTSYPLLVRDADVMQAQDWHVVVLDEAQNIKNPKSLAAQVCGGLKAKHRLCLTGTPMENHLGELWSLYNFLMPGLLSDADTFRQHYRNPIERDADAERQKQLSTRIQPLLLRRTKDAVAKELPPKTEILHSIELGRAQTDLYETIRAAMDKRVREAIEVNGLDRSQIVVLDALLKLRQVCCHPRLLKQETAQTVEDSAKTAYLMDEMLPELIEEGRRILIFSQFTEMLALIEARLKKEGMRYVKLTGSTKDRETPIQEFQAGKVPIFLISLKAGGAGINLTTADTVIHYDPWWNPAAEAQASDRAHRIGQKNPVFVHKLICENTIEERILKMQQKKAALVEGLLSGRSDKLQLTQADIQALFMAE